MIDPLDVAFGPVLFPVEPRSDEALYSLLARACTANMYDQVTWLTDYIGMPIHERRNHKWSSERAERLARLLSLPYEAIACRAYIAEGGEYQFLEHKITRSQFEWNCPKYCPQCLADRGYHSAVFDLVAIQVCPLHAVNLVTTCQVCFEKLSYGGDSLFCCRRCHADIRLFACEAVSTAELPGTAAIAAKAGFQGRHPAIEPPTQQFESAFNEVSLLELITTLQRLGTYASCEPMRRRWKSKFVSERNHVHVIISRGWEVLRDWPASFDAFLSKIADEHRNAHGSPTSPLVAFRSFYQRTAYGHRTGMNVIRSAFDTYLRERWDGPLEPVRRSSALITPGAKLNNKYISELELSRRVGAAQARAIIQSSPPDIVIERPRQKPRIFTNRAVVDAILPDDTKLLNLKEAGREIGLSTIFTKMLCDQGIISPIDGPLVSGRKRYLFSQSTLSKFVGSIANYSIGSGEGDRMVTFGALLRAHLALGFPIESALALISEGRLRPVRSNEHVSSLADLQFSRSELSRVLGSIPPSPTTVTRSWVIQQLEVNKRTVQFLIKEGYLQEYIGKGKQKPIIKRSFELFESQWIKVGLIARKFGTSRMLATRALLSKNIGSIICENDPSVASFFDRRAALSLSDPDKALDQVALHRGKNYSEYMASRREQGQQMA